MCDQPSRSWLVFDIAEDTVDLPGRLWQPRYSREEEEYEDELEGQGKAPGYSAANEREPIVDPVHQHEAEDVHHHLEDDKLATPFSRSGLSLFEAWLVTESTHRIIHIWLIGLTELSSGGLTYLPNRCSSCIQAIANTKHNSSDDHLSEVVGARLDDDADRHDDGAPNDGLLAAKPFAIGECKDCTEEAPDVVDRRNSRQDLSLRWSDQVVEFEKVISHDDTAEDTLILAEESHVCCTGKSQPE